ncbi:MAG: hypothetical protein MJZ40_04265 [Bacteroidaceae bacterium]|nr:hypothetical protein [Bacteroidaceae bacterium]
MKKNLLLLIFTALCMCMNAQAPASSTGTAKRTGDIDVKWVQLWENGPKFAEYNVGANSTTEYGGHYAWGGSQDLVDDHNTGTDVLTGNADTATKLWGTAWRMPTYAELELLLSKYDYIVTYVSDVSGYISGYEFTGKGDYASNSIFFPSAGYSIDGIVLSEGAAASYWASWPYDSESAFFGPGRAHSLRSEGCSVRAVLVEADPDEEELTTGITGLTIGNQQSAVYDLQGRKLNKLQRGLNMMNGKKVLR